MKKLLLIFLTILTLTSSAQVTTHGRRAIVNGVIPPTPGPNRLASPLLSSTVPGTTQINLSWTLADSRTTSYILERATDNMFTANLTTVYTGSSRAYSNTSLTTGTEYFYRVSGTASGLITSSYGVDANIAGNSVTVNFPGSGALTIDCSGYALGTTIHVTAGTYTQGINILNANGHVIDGTGVILQGDGTSSTYFNVIDIETSNKVIVKGIQTINIGYYPIYIQGSNSGGNNGIVLNGLVFQDCGRSAQFLQLNPTLVYAKTDASTYYLDFSRINCTFRNCVGWNTGSSIVSGSVTNLYRNWLESNNTFIRGDPQDMLDLYAIKNVQCYNNRIDSINNGNDFDNRLFKFQGWGDFFDNYATNYQGHVIAFYPVGFGDTVHITSTVHHNIFINSYHYSGVEMQEFTDNRGSTTFGTDLFVYNNTMGDLNTSHNMGFNANFVDNYQYNVMGCKTSLSNNLGFNFFQTPAINPATGREFVTNLNVPYSDINNKYVATKNLAIDAYLNSLFSTIGAY